SNAPRAPLSRRRVREAPEAARAPRGGTVSYQTRAGGRVTLTEAKREHYARVPTVTVSKHKRWAAHKSMKHAAKALKLPDLEIAWYRSYPESIIRADAALERLSSVLGDPWE